MDKLELEYRGNDRSRSVLQATTLTDLLLLLDLRLAGFEGGGDDMPITAFDGLDECIVFR
jgi:hypothetical protein